MESINMVRVPAPALGPAERTAGIGEEMAYVS